jgi:hypothetical protein
MKNVNNNEDGQLANDDVGSHIATILERCGIKKTIAVTNIPIEPAINNSVADIRSFATFHDHDLLKYFSRTTYISAKNGTTMQAI